MKEGIQRLHRLLEAENASTEGYEPLDTDGAAQTFETGFGRLFSSRESISPKVVKPYSEFLSGLWAGFEALDDACWVVMGFEPANTTESNSRDIDFESTQAYISSRRHRTAVAAVDHS